MKLSSKVDPRKAQIVALRYFAGLSVEETAKALNLSPATINNGRSPAHGCTGPLEQIAARAMARERDRRYQSANAMGSDLRAYLEGQPHNRG